MPCAMSVATPSEITLVTENVAGQGGPKGHSVAFCCEEVVFKGSRNMGTLEGVGSNVRGAEEKPWEPRPRLRAQ